MKLKKLVLTAAMAFLAICVHAQGVDFMPEGTLLKDAVAKAKQEGKMVFLDCYTSWCGPCKAMAKNIFPQQEVGDYMNPKFVSIKIDMEKGEGPALQEKLQISAYPTFIIFNNDGNEVGRFLGGSDAAELIERVKTNSVDHGSAALDARFAAGDRDPKFLMEYLGTLSNAYKRNQCAEVAEILLEGKAETFASDSTLRMIFMGHVSNPFCPAFVYTLKNPQKLQDAIGERPVMMKINSVLDRYPRTLVSEENGVATLDNEKFDAYINLLKECKLPNADHYRLSGLMYYAERKHDWAAYIDALESYTKNKNLDMDDMSLCRNAKPIMENCQDQGTLDRLKKIMEKRLADLKSGKRQPQTSMGMMKLSRPTSDIVQMLVDRLNGKPMQAPQQ